MAEKRSKRLKMADDFVAQYVTDVKTIYRPSYHVTPPIGWMNDPNGFSFYKDEYHLFYQFHPYYPKWGPMHWAHIRSKDLVSWEWLPIALAPDEDYDKDGCFSGAAIVDGDRHVLIYTGHVHPDPADREAVVQQQCMAYSEDGIHYEKLPNNPVITGDMLPEGSSREDFRDPSFIERAGCRYVLVANRGKDGCGRILVYRSDDLNAWEYCGVLCESGGSVGEMWECPDAFELDGEDVLLVSPMFLKQDGTEFSNMHSSVYRVGKMDFEKPAFTGGSYREIDHGLDFYAPQVLCAPDGRRIMIGWMQMWDRTYPTEEMKHGWACTMTIPRELSLRDGRLIQRPIRELELYRKNHVFYSDVALNGDISLPGVEGTSIDLVLQVTLRDAQMFSVRLFCADDEYAEVSWSGQDGRITFSRENIHTSVTGKEAHSVESRSFQTDLQSTLDLRILLDRSTVEIFACSGRYASSNTVFPVKRGSGIRFSADGLAVIDTLDKWEITDEAAVRPVGGV